MKVKKPNVDVAVHLSRGDKFVSEGRFDDGLIAYQIALEADPGNPLVYTSIGSVLELMGQFEDAVVAYQCSIKVCPNTTLSRFKMGCALHALGRARAAKAAFYACIRLNPDHVAAYNNLGIIEKALGDHAAALKNYSMAVELDPSFAKARDNLGLLFIAMGQPEDARAVYQESIDRELVDSRAEHLLAALMQDGQSVIPQTYVQQLFDDCAHTFEHHLVNTLNYQSPQILDAMLAQEICPPNPEDQIPFLTGLDLGWHWINGSDP